MAKKVVASLKNKSGVKYAKLVRSVKSDKTGAYKFKEEIVIEKYVNEILAGKSPQQVIDELRAKEKEKEKEAVKAADEALKEKTSKEESLKEKAPKEEVPKEETPKEEVPKEETPKEEAPKKGAPKEETHKSE
tara:strand:+ start:448 stop:846 length:399 start_codon:yes stop_codon:yes gene_type:complete